MTEQGKRWFERLIWTLIYGGLLMLVTSIAAGQNHPALRWVLAILGSLATAGGVVMIYIRSRIK